MNQVAKSQTSKGLIALLLVAIALSHGVQRVNAAAVASETYNTNFWSTDGEVESIVVGADGTVYIAGDFDNVGFSVNGLAAVDLATGDRVADALPSGFDAGANVEVIISDGQGGQYIGGDFELTVEGQAFTSLIHVDADGALDTTWAPTISASGTVYDLWLDEANGVLYVGGSFTAIGGASRDDLAGIDIVTGLATSFNPDSNGFVRALASDGSILYAGGSFETFNAGAVARNELAAFDLSSGTPSVPTDFNPDMNNTVYDLLIYEGDLYVSGLFSTVNGATTRNRVAAFDPDTGTATAFNPNGNGIAEVMHLIGDTLYVGGSFTSLGGSTRNRLAALNLASGTPSTATSFNPNIGSTVYSLSSEGTILYAGGAFTTVNGSTSRTRVAAFDTSVGHTALAFNPKADGQVNALFADDETLMLGGTFSMVDFAARRNFAAIDGETGEATALDPSPNLIVYDMALDSDSNILYVAGNFTNFGGGAVGRVGAIDLDTDTVIASFNPNVGSAVLAVAVHDSNVYIGGQFTAIAGGATARNYIAAVDSTDAALAFDPNLNDYVRDLLVVGDTLYVGGEFSTTAGGVTTRNRMAAFDLSADPADLPTAFDPNVTGGDVYAMGYYSSNIYFGGTFTTVDGEVRDQVAAASSSTGELGNFDPGTNGSSTSVRAMHVDNNILYIGGSFTGSGGVSSSSLVGFKLNATTPDAGLANFDVDIGGAVEGLATYDSVLYVGGSFSSIESGAVGAGGFVRFERGNRRPNTPTNLGNSETGTDATTSTAARLSFVTSDDDVDAENKYHIEIDDTADFSSPIIAYVSELGDTGQTSFRVGQPAGSGTYLAGGEGVTLGRGAYYWRVKAIDQHEEESGFAVANGGSTALVINSKTGYIPDGSSSGGSSSGNRAGITINSGAATTSSRRVQLALAYGPTATTMQVYNNGYDVNVTPLPAQPNLDWDICATPLDPAAACVEGATYSVSARFLNQVSNDGGRTFTDSIVYRSGIASDEAVLGESITDTTASAAFERFVEPFRYQWASQNGSVINGAHVINAKAGETIDLDLNLINRATDPKALTLYGTKDLLPQAAPFRGGHELRVGAGNPRDKIYDWLDPISFVSNPDGAPNRFDVFNGDPVQPNQQFDLSWTVKLKESLPSGTYDLYVELVREFDAWALQVDSSGRALPSSDIFWRIVVQ